MPSFELPNITVPQHLIIFSQALRPCLKKLERTLHTLSEPYFASIDNMPKPEAILQCAGLFFSSIDNLVNAMMTEVIANPDVTPETTYRQVGRFEGNLDILLDACAQAPYADFHNYPEVKPLLLGGLSHIVEQIRDWLKAICDTIDDPLHAYQNRPYDIENHSTVFSFELELTAPPEFKQLIQRAQQAAQSEKKALSRQKSDFGFWDTLGLFLLGCAFVDWLSDDD